jgi:hypothetical protein
MQCIETRGVVGHLPPNAYESGSGLGKTYLTFYGNFFNFFLLVAEFSALRQNMLS